ncbi:hypothetical protein [Flaviflexus sp.]|uniref:hypothetical protein n=1 Tax=Flaviflexus sp. TaxID=1969482 RepID=UPI003F8E2CA7
MSSRTLIEAEVIIVEPAIGSRIPVSAIGTDENGQNYVLTSDDSRVDIDIVTASRGMVIVDGVDVGTEVVSPVGQ